MIRTDACRGGLSRSGSSRGMGFNLFGMEVDLNPFHSPITQAALPVLQSIPILGTAITAAAGINNLVEGGNNQAAANAAIDQAKQAIDRANAQTAAANAAISQAHNLPAPAAPATQGMSTGMKVGLGVAAVGALALVLGAFSGGGNRGTKFAR